MAAQYAEHFDWQSGALNPQLSDGAVRRELILPQLDTVVEEAVDEATRIRRADKTLADFDTIQAALDAQTTKPNEKHRAANDKLQQLVNDETAETWDVRESAAVRLADRQIVLHELFPALVLEGDMTPDQEQHLAHQWLRLHDGSPTHDADLSTYEALLKPNGLLLLDMPLNSEAHEYLWQNGVYIFANPPKLTWRDGTMCVRLEVEEPQLGAGQEVSDEPLYLEMPLARLSESLAVGAGAIRDTLTTQIREGLVGNGEAEGFFMINDTLDMLYKAKLTGLVESTPELVAGCNRMAVAYFDEYIGLLPKHTEMPASYLWGRKGAVNQLGQELKSVADEPLLADALRTIETQMLKKMSQSQPEVTHGGAIAMAVLLANKPVSDISQLEGTPSEVAAATAILQAKRLTEAENAGTAADEAPAYRHRAS